MRIEILGTPFNGLGIPPDIENPADGIRQANLIPLLKSKGHSVTDLGDLSGLQFQEILDEETGIKDFKTWLELSNEISRRLEPILERQSFPLLLGGDCSMLVGIFSAFVQKDMDVGLIFLDGHADFHYPETSPTGDPADMELAILTGRGYEKIVQIAGQSPLLKDEDIVVYGIRAWDQIADSDIEVFDTKRMAKIGINVAVEEGLQSLKQRELPFWIHFDVDVLDPKFMPVMYPESGGLTFEEVQEFLMLARASGPNIGMSIACYHPMLDIDRNAGARLVTLLSYVLSIPSNLKNADTNIARMHRMPPGGRR